MKVLDVCCGSRMFWFDKGNQIALFGDKREEYHTLCDGRALEVSPNVQLDFTSLPFPDGSFPLVVFDPPHLENLGKSSWMYKKYGGLNEGWREELEKGFAECFRVLADNGVLVFKWNESRIKVSEILKLTPVRPLFGNRSGKQARTHWICFMKPESEIAA